MKPVYVINGFLDSGKTTFFAYTIGQPYFRSDGTTLLITCEEGEVGYGPKLLKATKTVREVIENPEDFTPANLMKMDSMYHPERILIEWNGMWDFRSMKLPHQWKLEQLITTIDATTFPMYFQNMKSLLAEQVRNAELIMFNRCDGIDRKTLINYKRNIKAINTKADLIFEDQNGEVDTAEAEELPYDIKRDPIVLEGLDYGIWYQDAMEHPDWYVGKNVCFTGTVMKPAGFPKGYFVPGRMVMGCCANDMMFCGFACRSDKTDVLKEKQWVRVTASVDYREFKEYDGEGIVLTASSVVLTDEPAHAVLDFTQP